MAKHTLKILRCSRVLKGKDVSITESLAKDCMIKLNEARETYGFRNVWTSDDKIFFKDEANLLSTMINFCDK